MVLVRLGNARKPVSGMCTLGDILGHTEHWHELRGLHTFCPSGCQRQGLRIEHAFLQ